MNDSWKVSQHFYTENYKIQLTFKQHGFELCSPLRHNFFSSVRTTVLHNPWLVEPSDGELWIWRNDCKVMYKVLTVRRVGTPSPHVVQGSTVLLRKIREDLNKWKKTPRSQIKEHSIVRHQLGLKIP